MDQTLYARTLQEVKDAEATPSPADDMTHAHMLLEQLTPMELLQATFLLEEFLEQTPAFHARLEARRDETAGTRVGMDEVLADQGLRLDSSGTLATDDAPHRAA